MPGTECDFAEGKKVKMQNKDKQSWHCGMETEEKDYVCSILYPYYLSLRPYCISKCFSLYHFISALYSSYTVHPVTLHFLREDGRLSSQHSSTIYLISLLLPVCPFLPAVYESYNRLPVMLIK